MDPETEVSNEGGALVPSKEKTVDFYGDAIPVAQFADEELYVPLRQLTDFLGLAADPQRRRVLRDEVLKERLRRVLITAADGKRYATLCLPLDLLPGWLFGITPTRVRPELRDKLNRYRAECFRVLWNAFKVDILPAATPSATGLTSAQQTLEMITAMQHLAQQQVDLEARQTATDARVEAIATYLRPFVQDTRQRLTALELRLDPKNVLTEDQAAEIALAVKHVGQHLAAQGERTGYARVYSELYRRFGISSYKNLPHARYDEVLAWLHSWHEELKGPT